MKRAAFFSAAILILGLGSLAGCSTTSEKPLSKPQPERAAEINLELGIDYLRKGNLQQAKEKIDRALEQMAAAWDPSERSKASGDLAAAFAEVWPIAGIVADAPQGLIHRRVQNVKVWDGWLDLSQLRLDSAP